jgi:hypothetical protein
MSSISRAQGLAAAVRLVPALRHLQVVGAAVGQAGQGVLQGESLDLGAARTQRVLEVELGLEGAGIAPQHDQQIGRVHRHQQGQCARLRVQGQRHEGRPHQQAHRRQRMARHRRELRHGAGRVGGRAQHCHHQGHAGGAVQQQHADQQHRPGQPGRMHQPQVLPLPQGQRRVVGRWPVADALPADQAEQADGRADEQGVPGTARAQQTDDEGADGVEGRAVERALVELVGGAALAVGLGGRNGVHRGLQPSPCRTAAAWDSA